MDTLMKCGHSANAVYNGKPVCAICFMRDGDDATQVENDRPSLEGRMATCTCGKEVPSSYGLAFFEYRGGVSRHCGVCGFYDIAHPDVYEINPATGRRNRSTYLHKSPHKFTPKVFTTDSFYCGCRGWD